MKKVWYMLHACVPFLLCSLLIAALYVRTCIGLCNVQLSFSFDDYFSSSQKQSITKEFIKSIRSDGPSKTLAYIQKKYPLVALITCKYMIPGSAHVVFHAHNPCILCNHIMVATDSGLLFSTDMYDESVLVGLPHISISEKYICEDRLPKRIVNLYANIPRDLFYEYHVTWRDDHVLELNDKNNIKKIFVCDTANTPDIKTLELCHIVAEEHMHTKQQKPIVVDVRFSNQVIVYGNTRGYGHGSGIG